MKKPSLKISLFYCSNSISLADLSTCIAHIDKDSELNAISLPCSGKVNLLYLLKAIETGSDGVLLMTCKFGECKYLQGNYRAQKRADAVNSLLLETDAKGGNVKFIQFDGVDKINIIVDEINDFIKQLKTEQETVGEIA